MEPNSQQGRDEQFIRELLTDFDPPISPDFHQRLMARIAVEERQQPRAQGQPSWVQRWTPAVAMGAVAMVFAVLVGQWQKPDKYRSVNNGQTPNTEEQETFDALIEKGKKAHRIGDSVAERLAYEKAINKMAFVLNELAWLAYKQNEAEKGLSWAQLAVQLQPEEPAYLDTLASILCVTGAKDEAVRILEKAAKLRPQDLQKKLEKLRRGICQ